jgi:predicted membrane channel-forming protein YqfA (hemolysin III family)
MIATILAIAVAGALLFWMFGGIVLRWFGLFVFWGGLATLAVSRDFVMVWGIAVGGLLWIAGHYLYWVRWDEVTSPLAWYVLGAVDTVAHRVRDRLRSRGPRPRRQLRRERDREPTSVR